VPGGEVATVVGGQLLLDDVCAEGDAEVVGLSGEVGRGMVVDAVHLEACVAGVAPQDGGHAELVGDLEGFCNFFQLAVAFCAAPVYGGSDGDGAHVPGGFNGAEHSLVIAVGGAEEFVAVELDEEGNAVCVFAAHDIQDAKGRGNGVAAGFYGELYNIFRVEVHGVGGEGCAAAVLDALVDGEDGEVAGVGEPSVADKCLYASQHRVGAG